MLMRNKRPIKASDLGYDKGYDPYFKNFAMIIPSQAIKFEEQVEDPLGVPIYAGCPAKGDLCACTGRCKVIIGHTTDPERLATYRKQIKEYNDFWKGGGLQKLYGERKWDGEEITFITYRKQKPG